MDLYNEIQDLRKELNTKIQELAGTGCNYATSYKDYRIKLAKELLRLKAEGMPVTIAYDIARGNEDVAEAKFNELSTEAVYKANLESINAIKLQIKILENQYQKEWGQGGAYYDWYRVLPNIIFIIYYIFTC